MGQTKLGSYPGASTNKWPSQKNSKKIITYGNIEILFETDNLSLYVDHRVACTLLQTDNHTSTPPLWPLIMILPRASTHLNPVLVLSLS